jgi:hypothetical protein
VASPAIRAAEGSCRIDLVWISCVWLAAGLLLLPFQDAPFIDDWVYGWSVERLLNGGDLRVLDHSTSLNVIQIGWGALFCIPFGFSFSALRVSTWVAGLLGAVGHVPDTARSGRQSRSGATRHSLPRRLPDLLPSGFP